jgi:hypothetical protein
MHYRITFTAVHPDRKAYEHLQYVFSSKSGSMTLGIWSLSSQLVASTELAIWAVTQISLLFWPLSTY